MINAIIVDDEVNSCDILKIKLSKFENDITVLGIAQNIDDAEELIKELQPDLVFLDIQMPGGSGFELLNRFTEIFFDVVFVTAYDEYALKALKHNAVDYLLKPLNTTELNECVERLKKRHHNLKQNYPLKNFKLLEISFKEAHSKVNKLIVPTVDGFEIVVLSEVIYFEAESNYTRVYCIDETEHLISRTLKSFEDSLKDIHFIRIHHGYLININHVVGFVDGKVVMSNGVEISVSRRKRTEFQRYFY